jgi:predicted acetyltransferase
VPALIPPTVDVHASFLVAMAEHRAEGRGLLGDQSNVGQQIRLYGAGWADRAEFAQFVDDLHAATLDPVLPTTTLWWVDGDEYLARLAIRHRLGPGRAGERNGHIGYDVRPSARRQGHATRMLAESLPLAAKLGLAEVLLTCDDDNVASRRTIERNGGVLHDRLDEKLRFWLPTG